MGSSVVLHLLFFLAQGFVLPPPPQATDQVYADTVLFNGKIVSMDDRSTTPNSPGSIFEAIAIKGKKIMALGSDEEMRGLAGPGTHLIDLSKKTVIPGLILTNYEVGPDEVNYGPTFGLVDRSIKLSVVSEPTAEATSRQIRETITNALREQQIRKGTWISVDLEESQDNRPGTSSTWLYLGKINRRHIDPITEQYPVLITTGRQGFLNTAAITEIKEIFPEWEESTDLERGPGAARDGYATIPNLSGLAFEYWWRNVPPGRLAQVFLLRGLEFIERGITTVSGTIPFPTVLTAYHHLNRQGRLPHRLAYSLSPQRGRFWNLKTTREFYKGSGAIWTPHVAGNEMVWLTGMSNGVWDSTLDQVCLGPDVDVSEEIRNRERCPSPGTKPWESIKGGITGGWRPVGVNGTSSHGARLYIQMLEQAMEEAGLSQEYIRDLRSTLEHNQLLGTPPDVMEKIKAYGIILNVTPSYLQEARTLIDVYGEQLRPFAMPVNTWIDSGIRVTLNAADLDTWTAIYTLVTREVNNPLGRQREKLLPKEAIDRVTALKMVTTWASEYVLAEDTIGTLEPGKFADFTVLDRDFFTIPIVEIREVQVTMVGLNGDIVYPFTRAYVWLCGNHSPRHAADSGDEMEKLTRENGCEDWHLIQ